VVKFLTILRKEWRIIMKALIIIPTYNEKENVKEIISAVLGVNPSIDILIVDDSSPDGTSIIVQEIMKKDSRVHLLSREKKSGLGTAYITGFKYALENNYDYAFEMDADFSHNPDDIPKFLEALKDYDLVIGSRYCDGISVVNWPISRLFLSYFANLYSRLIIGVPIFDLTSGFKGYRRAVLESIDFSKIKSDGYGFQIEMKFYAHRNGFRIKELPVIFIDRRSGHSKMSKKIIWEAFWVVWMLKIKNVFKIR